MSTRWLIAVVLLLEAGLFLAEVILAASNRRNRKLRQSNSAEEVDFIDLEEGYSTGVSFFRISLFVSYVLLVTLLLDFSSQKLVMEILVYSVIGILVYVLIMFNIRVFSFYSDRFIVWTPFRIIQPKLMIEYDEIEDFRIYRALYNAYFLHLQLKGNKIKRIEFTGTSLLRNDLAIRIILNTKTGLNKDFVHHKWNRKPKNK